MKLQSKSKVEITQELYGPDLDSLSSAAMIVIPSDSSRIVTTVTVDGVTVYTEDKLSRIKGHTEPLERFIRWVEGKKETYKEPRTYATLGEDSRTIELITEILQKYEKSLLHHLATQQESKKCLQNDGSLPHREPVSQCESKRRIGKCPASHPPRCGENGKCFCCMLPQVPCKSDQWRLVRTYSTLPCDQEYSPAGPNANRF